MRRTAVLIACLTLCGCKARDGDILLKAAARLADKFEAAGSGELTARFRAAAGESSVGGRVESRLRWDRYLKGSEIEVALTGVGEVALRGEVADAALKARAVELARTTVGVERVVDELKVAGEDD